MQKPEKAKTGRARATFPILEGIQAAAAQLGCPVALIKAVKAGGSKAFLTHNRIDVGILLPELFAAMSKGGNDLPDGFASWKEYGESERAKRERIKREQDEGRTMLTADAQAQAAAAMALVFAELERRDRELPPALAGQPAMEVHRRMAADTESIRKTLTQKFEEIGK